MTNAVLMYRRMFVTDKNPRAAWSKPVLKKIDAGSAEARVNTGTNDGGKSPPQKS